MIHIRYLQKEDKSFFSLDKHLSHEEFKRKVRDQMGYILLLGNQAIGILRYHLFWDEIPFCTLLFIKSNFKEKIMEKD